MVKMEFGVCTNCEEKEKTNNLYQVLFDSMEEYVIF